MDKNEMKSHEDLSFEDMAYSYMLQLAYTDNRLKNIQTSIKHKATIPVFNGNDMQHAFVDGIKAGEKSVWIWILIYLKEHYNMSEDDLKTILNDSNLQHCSDDVIKIIEQLFK